MQVRKKAKQILLVGVAALMAGAGGPARGQPAVSQEAEPPGPAPALCDAPWFRSGSRVQLEGDGVMPMSITMTLRDASTSATGCHAQLEVRSKSALSALMGPPVVMDQAHAFNVGRRTASAPGRIESQHAVINARARYARMYGEAAFKGSGVFSYAGMNIREGTTLDGETFESSVSLRIYPLGSDEAVSSMRAQHASIIVGTRHVGRRQWIETAMGRKECMPITYEKRTSLGPLLVGDDVVHVEPTVMHVTDWYCPSDAFVLRTEVRQQDKVQRVDVISLERDTEAP